ncbi:MAG: hypothetical protein V5A46_09535 [Haloferacaceae archaeon]
MRRTMATLGMAVLLLTAGCAALGPGDGPATSPTEGATPTETGAETGTGSDGETGDDATDAPPATPERPPWIDGNELDAGALEATHVDAVMESGSFRIASEVTTTHEGEDHPLPWFENQTLETGWNVEHERRYLDNEFRETPERLTLYAENATVYVRERAGDRVRYAVEPANRTSEEFREKMRGDARTGTGALSEWTFQFEGTEECGELTCYRFSGTDFEGDRDVPETVTDGTATLVVDERGIVRELTQEFEGESEGQAVSVVVTSEYRGVGETTLPEPGWIEEAREATATDEDGS